MKVVDKQFFIVGYRRNDNDEWKTSGLSYNNEIDAQSELIKQRYYLPKLQYEVFKFGRAMPLNFDVKQYDDFDNDKLMEKGE